MQDKSIPSYNRLITNDAQIKEIIALSEYISRWKPEIDAVEAVVPSDASPINLLATESSVATNSATFQGNYNSVTDLGLTTAATRSDIEAALGTTITGADNNDYCWVDIPTSDQTPTQIAATERYKYNGTSWSFEFSPTPAFSASQWAAIDSGINSEKVQGMVLSTTVSNIVTLTQAEYDLITPDANTLYFIKEV